MPHLPKAPALLVAGVLFGAGCAEEDPGPQFVSPYDGRTDWPPEAPLQVQLGQPVAPEGTDVDPDLITVVDLDVGGRVEGAIVVGDSALWFYPDAPFEPGHRFAWSVAPPHDEARSVHLAVPASLTGSATFSTAPAAEPLGALSLGSDICIVWSRAVPEEGQLPAGSGLSIHADGLPVGVEPAIPAGVPGIEPLTPGDASLGCLGLTDAGIDAATIQGVRVEGPLQVWQLTVEDRSAEDLLAERHRLGAGSEEGT